MVQQCVELSDKGPFGGEVNTMSLCCIGSTVNYSVKGTCAASGHFTTASCAKTVIEIRIRTAEL
jgi:hypothetical protein